MLTVWIENILYFFYFFYFFDLNLLVDFEFEMNLRLSIGIGWQRQSNNNRTIQHPQPSKQQVRTRTWNRMGQTSSYWTNQVNENCYSNLHLLFGNEIDRRSLLMLQNRKIFICPLNYSLFFFHRLPCSPFSHQLDFVSLFVVINTVLPKVNRTEKEIAVDDNDAGDNNH